MLKSLEAKEVSEELYLDLSNVCVGTMVLGASEGWVHGGAAQAVSVDSVHVLLSSGKKISVFSSCHF